MKRHFTSLIILLFISIFYKLSGQQLHKDTAFLFKKANHSIFIDNSPISKFYDRISDFRFSKFDKDNYDYSLQYLKDSGIKLTKYRIKDLPKKWIILKYFKDRFYLYYPCDFYHHFKVSITDNAFIDYGGEGPVVNKILSFKKISNIKFYFSLTGVERPKRYLTIHIVDIANGIAIFEEWYDNNDRQYYLMIDATKIRRQPIVVNYCKDQKQMEFDFVEPDFFKLLKKQ